MTRKQINNAIEIFSISIMFCGLIFLFIYKTFNLLDTNPLIARYFYYIFIISLFFFIARLVSIIKEGRYLITKILFTALEIGFVVYFILVSYSMTWAFVILSFILFYTTVLYGKKFGLGVLIISTIATGGALLFGNIAFVKDGRFFEYCVIYAILVYTILFIFWYMASLIESQINKEESRYEEQEVKLQEQISINKKLQNKLEGINEFNENLEAANRKLEANNQRLNKSAAEFYTLQQISQAIATILDIKELLKFVNDVIIGVMGVSYSTILLSDKETGKMKIKITNIYSEAALAVLKGNIDNDLLKNIIKTGEPLINNNVDEEVYSFTKGREVKSLLCIPLSSKNESYGVVLVEQERPDAFEDEHVKFLMAISNQISVALENVGLYEKMQQMATTDALTKIYNRLYFNEMLSKEMANADIGNYSMAISIFDIDHFKKFNDTYGHLFGDLVLKTIARLAKDHVRENDIVARFGGEEFVIIMSNTSEKEASEIIEKLREKISNYYIKDGSITANVTASFGIACYPKHGSVEAEVLSAADTALYKAKMEGRNCVRIFEKE